MGYNRKIVKVDNEIISTPRKPRCIKGLRG